MNAELPGTPGFPPLLSDEELEANVAERDDTNTSLQKQPTDKELADAAIATLKAEFPRIHKNLLPLWGTAQGEAYLDGLIVDERGDRQGFPPDVLRSLLVLQRVHFELFGTFKRVDPWDTGFNK
jgi:hypothetical protein